MEDINLHFTGDLTRSPPPANLISAMIDNSLQQGNELNLDSAASSGEGEWT
ncbi:hypothetical protein MASR1M66_04280 [Aminivibrio sp.]